MTWLIGQAFIGIQTHDLDAARIFCREVLELKLALHSPPGAVVFDTGPVSFAVRTPPAKLRDPDSLDGDRALVRL
jgi:hypothetical protein